MKKDKIEVYYKDKGKIKGFEVKKLNPKFGVPESISIYFEEIKIALEDIDLKSNCNKR